MTEVKADQNMKIYLINTPERLLETVEETTTWKSELEREQQTKESENRSDLGFFSENRVRIGTKEAY